jgi:hypothetical protein
MGSAEKRNHFIEKDVPTVKMASNSERDMGLSQPNKFNLVVNK